MYRRMQDPAADEQHFLQAPDVTEGSDGRFYLYYNLALLPFVSVAVSDRPEGPYEYLGRVKRPNGNAVGLEERDVFMFDPGIFKDDDGKIYLYAGFGPADDGPLGFVCKKYQMNGAYVCELEQDMQTVKAEPHLIAPKVGHGAELPGFNVQNGHSFYEASSLRKIGNKYYFIYSSEQSHELCYAVSDRPDREFVYGGTLISNADVGIDGNNDFKNYAGNTHGSIACIKGEWYVFYHRQTNRCQYARQACAEKITMTENGQFLQAETTSCGLRGVLPGTGIFDAAIACHLFISALSESVEIPAYNYDSGSNTLSDEEKAEHPYFTQSGNDREDSPDQYIANLRNGACCGYKYFEFNGTDSVELLIRGKAKGRIYMYKEPILPKQMPDAAATHAVISIDIHSDQWEKVSKKFRSLSGRNPLYFVYEGVGSVDLKTIKLSIAGGSR